MQINFRNTLVNQDDSKLEKILSISHEELRESEYNNIENYSRFIEVLQYFQTKDYAKTYLNLKNRNRYHIMNYIEDFKETLQELKTLVGKELANS